MALWVCMTGSVLEERHTHLASTPQPPPTPYTYSYCMYIQYQERMIVRGGGRGCNFARFGNGQNNPPVLFLEHVRNMWHNFVLLCSYIQYVVNIPPVLRASIGVTRSSSSAYNHVLLVLSTYVYCTTCMMCVIFSPFCGFLILM